MNPTVSPAADTAEAAAVEKFAAHFIGGTWKPAASDERIEVINSVTEQVMGSVPAGTAGDVDSAVEAARAAHAGRRVLA